MKSVFMAVKKVRLNTRRLRQQRHLTQQEVARKTSLSKTTISNLESGKQVKIELNTIGKLCEVFECTPSEIFLLEEDSEQNATKKQKNALKAFIGTLSYDKTFNPKDLDFDLTQEK